MVKTEDDTIMDVKPKHADAAAVNHKDESAVDVKSEEEEADVEMKVEEEPISNAEFETVIHVEDFVGVKLEEEEVEVLKLDDDATTPGPLECDCEHCGKTMVSKSGLIMHIRRKHREVQQYKCGLCWKEFRKKRGARDHTRDARQTQTEPIWISATLST